ncbi:hypothetical protein BDN67DRAFT_965784 [Paxillus ammoniavirescens]|nr:hypothetical protein BDN67DRAFT_965784 [Paxillus ammoniavirescens]
MATTAHCGLACAKLAWDPSMFDAIVIYIIPFNQQNDEPAMDQPLDRPCSSQSQAKCFDGGIIPGPTERILSMMGSHLTQHVARQRHSRLFPGCSRYTQLSIRCIRYLNSTRHSTAASLPHFDAEGSARHPFAYGNYVYLDLRASGCPECTDMMH